WLVREPPHRKSLCRREQGREERQKRHRGLRVTQRRDRRENSEHNTRRNRASLRPQATHRAYRALLDPLQRTPLVATAPGVGKCSKTSATSLTTRLSRFAGFDVWWTRFVSMPRQSSAPVRASSMSTVSVPSSHEYMSQPPPQPPQPP